MKLIVIMLHGKRQALPVVKVEERLVEVKGLASPLSKTLIYAQDVVNKDIYRIYSDDPFDEVMRGFSGMFGSVYALGQEPAQIESLM